VPSSPSPESLSSLFAEAAPEVPQSISEVDRVMVARDLWPRHHLEVRAGGVGGEKPALVLWPRSTDEVARVVRTCAREGLPIVPYGAGSGVCGGILPNERSVVLDLKRLNRWRALDPERPTLDVEPGVLGMRLEEELQAKGFTVGHFPSSILCSTVGGWVAGRGAGQCSGRYGKIEDMVASLELVDGRGEVVKLERRVIGPDLIPLVTGSEGVFGVITSAELRLHPVPAARAFGSYSFPTVEAGWSAMRELYQAGLRPAVSRLYDPFDSFVARQKKPGHTRPSASESRVRDPGAGSFVLRTLLKHPRALNGLVDALGDRVLKGSTLVLVFEGPAGEPEGDLVRADAIARRLGARPLGEGPARHWLERRYAVSYRQAPVFMSGSFSDTLEVAATWSRLGGLYEGVRRALGDTVFVMAHLSHAYPDGCSIYFTFAGSAETPEAMIALYDRTWRAALDAALESGGTLSHHHGVGRSKSPRLGPELGLGVDLVRALSGVFDPHGIMNPGNLMPRDLPTLRDVPPPPPEPLIDRTSQLVRVAGDATLASVEQALAAERLSLCVRSATFSPATTTVASWIAQGMPGAPDPWDDPVDHVVAGYTAKLRSGARLEVRPGPRRAVGPDLFALFHGTGDAAGVIESAWLRARPLARARTLPSRIERNPPLGAAERGLVDRVLDAAAAVKR
jgi:alkyldihydroxyacetonephosphate synthase